MSPRGAWRWAARVHAAWYLAALAVAPLACAGEDERPPSIEPRDTRRSRPIAGCEEFEYRTCAITEASCQSEIFELMRCAYGVPEGTASIPPISLLTRAEAFELLSGSPEDSGDLDPADFEASMRARENLGLIEPGLVGSESDSLELTLEGVAGLYLFASQEIIVIDGGDSMADLAANTTLAHELVHALQDQVHDLGALSASIEQTSDAALAFASLVEGEASVYELQMWVAYQGRGMDALDYDWLRDTGDDMSRESGSPALTARLIFPYTYGTRYAVDLWLAGGGAALSAAYGAPPADTLEVVAGTTADRTPVDDMPAPLDGYSVLEEDVAGAWLMATTLAELSGDQPTDLAVLAASWRGDRLVVYRESEGEGVVVDWTIHARDDAAAQRIAAIYEGWRPPAGELALRADGSTLHVVVSDAPSDAAEWLERWGSAAQ
ncbi:MAG: hypothetical protein ABW217_20130 [Polyangiaceae bacterium]